jgi:hypothetical protein
MDQPHKDKDYLFVLTSAWIAFVVLLKFLEHHRAFNEVEVGFRYDLYIILPMLVFFTIYVLWKHWDDLDDNSS